MSKNDVIRQLVDALEVAIIGSCTCGMKTSDYSLHKDSCMFKLCMKVIAAGEAELAKPDPEPVARLLYWNAPSHIPVPHGGIAARTYEEFPEDTPLENRYWFEGAKLYTTPPEPKEWKLVPVEPTEEMIKTGQGWREWDDGSLPLVRCYKAMLSSSPDYKG